jgi:serine protease Do
MRSTLMIIAGLAGLVPSASAQQLRNLFQRASKSVVVVRTLEKGLTSEPTGEVAVSDGLGSGTIISKDGRILTAAHVVQTADRVGVELKDGRFYAARVVASSPRADVALLQLDDPPVDLVPAPIGNSDSLETGDQVMVVGAPYGLSYTLTSGHVSGRLRPEGTIGGMPMEFIQTDAAINQGNSGGPMFNLKGEVVGVVSYILTQSGGFEGLGFAVASNVARRLLLGAPSFWTGVDGLLLKGDLARLFNLPQPAGLLIQQVADGSPAAEIGLRPGSTRVRIEDQTILVGGDVVLSVGEIQVTGESEIQDRVEQYLRTLARGKPITVRVLRGGLVLTLEGVRGS